MSTETIPGNVEADLWSLATEVCRRAKIDDDQWDVLLPKLKTKLDQRWRSECQIATDLEQAEWKEKIILQYRRLAKTTQEPIWRRFLYYVRNKHLRFIVILICSEVVFYCCRQTTIVLVFVRIPLLWQFWYGASILLLVCVPCVLALTIGTERLLIRRIAEKITSGVLALGLIVPVVVFFSVIFERWYHGFSIVWELGPGSGDSPAWWTWLPLACAIPFCLCGLLTSIAEVFRWSQKRSPHPLLLALRIQEKTEHDKESNEIEQKLIQFALKICTVSHMDRSEFAREATEDIYNTLFIQWDELVQEGGNPDDALDETLRAFGTPDAAAHKDDIAVRILFYQRHNSTRYLLIIGTTLVLYCILMLSINGSDPSGIFDRAVEGENLLLLTNVYDNGERSLWMIMNRNLFDGVLFALCIFAKHRLGTKIGSLNHMFGIAALWWLAQISLNVIAVFHNIAMKRAWSESSFALNVCGALTVPALSCLLCCAVCEYFSPVSEEIVAWIRRVGTRCADWLTKKLSRKVVS